MTLPVAKQIDRVRGQRRTERPPRKGRPMTVPLRMVWMVVVTSLCWQLGTRAAAVATVRGDASMSASQGTGSSQQQAAERQKAAKKKTTRKAVRGESDNARQRTNNAEKPRRLPGVTRAREAAVMTFVEQHQPKLAALLIYLKENQPAEYQKAVRDLLRISDRLALYHERDPQRYESELKLWKLSSRIELLAAQLRMEDRAEVRQHLREAFELQHELRREILQQRIEKMKQQLTRMDENAERDVERQFRAMLRKVRPGTLNEKLNEKATGAQPASKGSQQ